MGLIWDLLQEKDIRQQKEDIQSLEERVEWLEAEVDRLHTNMGILVRYLENRLLADIDGDGKIGQTADD